jgi:hypothetical protein
MGARAPLRQALEASAKEAGQVIYIAGAALAVAAITAVVLGNLLRIVIRQGARERELLVNQICHLSNKPWQEAPAYEEHELVESSLSSVPPEQYFSDLA